MAAQVVAELGRRAVAPLRLAVQRLQEDDVEVARQLPGAALPGPLGAERLAAARGDAGRHDRLVPRAAIAAAAALSWRFGSCPVSRR